MKDTKLYSNSAAYYKECLSQFQSFMNLCASEISDNKFFEFISFNYKSGSNFGEMLAFGVTHKISFDFVVDKEDQFAILEFITTHKTCPQDTEIRLARWHFDNLGNLKDSPNERFLMYSISDTKFLDVFLNKTLANYFSYIKRLDEEASSSQ